MVQPVSAGLTSGLLTSKCVVAPDIIGDPDKHEHQATKTLLTGMLGQVAVTTAFNNSMTNDLVNKPTIPTNNNQFTNGAGYITSSSHGAVATNLMGQQ